MKRQWYGTSRGIYSYEFRLGSLFIEFFFNTPFVWEVQYKHDYTPETVWDCTFFNQVMVGFYTPYGREKFS